MRTAGQRYRFSDRRSEHTKSPFGIPFFSVVSQSENSMAAREEIPSFTGSLMPGVLGANNFVEVPVECHDLHTSARSSTTSRASTTPGAGTAPLAASPRSARRPPVGAKSSRPHDASVEQSLRCLGPPPSFWAALRASQWVRFPASTAPGHRLASPRRVQHLSATPKEPVSGKLRSAHVRLAPSDFGGQP